MLDKMIDIHCHILPSIDDGSKNLEESLAMARTAVEQGVQVIIATPHYIPGDIEYEKDYVMERVLKLQECIDQMKLNCRIYPGMELYLSRQLFKKMDEGCIFPLGGTGKYVLVEFPGRRLDPNDMSLLHEVKIRGYVPVIAHPERNGGILEDHFLVNDLIQQGALLQVNAESIVGFHGKQVQKLALDFVKQGIVSFVSSDGHSATRRTIRNREAYTMLRGTLAEETLHAIFYLNARRLLDGEILVPVKNLYHRTKSGLFESLRRRMSLG